MGTNATFYRIILGEGLLAASTSINGLPGLLKGDAPGRYVIEELTIPPGLLSLPKSRKWGCAIKHVDGRVELQPDEPAPCIDLGQARKAARLRNQPDEKAG